VAYLTKTAGGATGGIRRRRAKWIAPVLHQLFWSDTPLQIFVWLAKLLLGHEAVIAYALGRQSPPVLTSSGKSSTVISSRELAPGSLSVFRSSRTFPGHRTFRSPQVHRAPGALSAQGVHYASAKGLSEQCEILLCVRNAEDRC